MGKPRNDITGIRFGRLVAVKYLGGGKWLCKCDCGNTANVPYNHLNTGNTKSCGCLNNEIIHRKRRNSSNLTGRTFGTLEVLEYVDSDSNGTRWRCRCKNCGNITVVNAAWLKNYQSCGCKSKEAGKANVDAYKNVIQTTNTNPNRFINNKPNKNNKIGIKGVCYLKKSGTYVAYITFKGERKTLKRSKDINEAIRARKEAEANLDDFLTWYKDWQK